MSKTHCNKLSFSSVTSPKHFSIFTFNQSPRDTQVCILKDYTGRYLKNVRYICQTLVKAPQGYLIKHSLQTVLENTISRFFEEIQKTSNSQSNLEKEEWNWRNQSA